MRARLPESLRNDPHVRQESVRLLLAALLRTTNDAIAHDRTHPMFVPELNIVQNIFQPNADTIYKTALIAKARAYRIRGKRGDVRMLDYGADGKCGLAAARRAHQAHRPVEADDQEFHIAGEGI